MGNLDEQRDLEVVRRCTRIIEAVTGQPPVGWSSHGSRRGPYTVLSLLNSNPARPGFEHDHHELMAITAPRAFLLIGGSQSEDHGGDSDDLESWGYLNRAREVYQLLGVPDRIGYVSTHNGHKPNGPDIDPAWRAFFERWLKQTPI